MRTRIAWWQRDGLKRAGIGVGIGRLTEVRLMTKTWGDEGTVGGFSMWFRSGFVEMGDRYGGGCFRWRPLGDGSINMFFVLTIGRLGGSL